MLPSKILPPSSSCMIYVRMSSGPPTNVTIRAGSSKARASFPRLGCRLLIVHCALLVVNARRFYEARQQEPIIPALLPRDGKRDERGGGKEKGQGERMEKHTNPFNRESIYITDLSNNIIR